MLRRPAPAGARRPGGQGARAGAAAVDQPARALDTLLPASPPAARPSSAEGYLSPPLSLSFSSPALPPFFCFCSSPPPAFLLLQENNLTVDLLTGEEFASWIKKKKKAERSLGTVARGE